MAHTFAGQTAVITGASSGIGEALARVLAADGCKVGLLARRHDLLAELTTAIEASGGRAACAAVDVTESAQVERGVATLAEQLGPIDLLIANAGVGRPTLLDPVNIADVEQMFRVNVLGVAYSIAAVLPSMLRRGRGHLVAVSSMAAYKGLPGESAYCATKAAVNAYMEGLRIQLRERGIAVTTVCPGFIATPMTADNKFQMPWLIDADEAARRIVRALRRRPGVYNFPWQMSLLMKLTRLLPDRVVARRMRKYNENPPFPNGPA